MRTFNVSLDPCAIHSPRQPPPHAVFVLGKCNAHKLVMIYGPQPNGRHNRKKGFFSVFPSRKMRSWRKAQFSAAKKSARNTTMRSQRGRMSAWALREEKTSIIFGLVLFSAVCVGHNRVYSSNSPANIKHFQLKFWTLLRLRLYAKSLMPSAWCDAIASTTAFVIFKGFRDKSFARWFREMLF